MNDQQLLERIVCNANIMTGKPVIKGTRLTVEFILNLRAHGASEQEILDEYAGVTPEALQACYLFAGKSPGNMAFMPLTLEAARFGLNIF